MAYGRSRLNANNSRACLNCGTTIYWKVGDYCASCAELPERRCLDCGATTRTGTLDYAYPEPAPVFTQYREARGDREGWTPKPPKPDKERVYRNLAKRAVHGACLGCGSANLARLEFGLDRLPEEQRVCSAWPNLATDWLWRGYGKWLEKAAEDPGIKPRLCATCDRPLYVVKASGRMDGARLTADGMGIRHPRVDLPDGKWREAEDWVHASCPDPVYEVTLAYETEDGNLYDQRIVRAAA